MPGSEVYKYNRNLFKCLSIRVKFGHWSKCVAKMLTLSICSVLNILLQRQTCKLTLYQFAYVSCFMCNPKFFSR